MWNLDVIAFGVIGTWVGHNLTFVFGGDEGDETYCSVCIFVVIK